MAEKPLNSHYDQSPELYDALRESWMSSRREALFLDFLADAPPASRVLEIGAGTARLLSALATARPDLEFVGIEPLPTYVSYAQDRIRSAGLDNVQIIRGSVDDTVGLDKAGFHSVVSVDVLHHVGDLERTTRNLRDATEPGARWLLVEPNVLNLYMFGFCVLTTGERNFWPGRFVRAASQAGWRKVDHEYRFMIPSTVKQPRPWLKKMEARLERLPPAAGAVTLTMEQHPPR